MELPWLKNKSKYQNRYAGGGSAIEREPDSTHPDKLIEMIADEMIEAFHKKDHAGFREALRAFVLSIQDQDEAQDGL